MSEGVEEKFGSKRGNDLPNKELKRIRCTKCIEKALSVEILRALKA